MTSATTLPLVAAMLLMAAIEIADVTRIVTMMVKQCTRYTAILFTSLLTICSSLSVTENPPCTWLKTRDILPSSTRCGLLELIDLPLPPLYPLGLVSHQRSPLERVHPSAIPRRMQLRNNIDAAYAARARYNACNTHHATRSKKRVRNNSVNALLHAPCLLPALTCLAAASLVSRAAQGNAALT